jgi:hypothetical protein
MEHLLMEIRPIAYSIAEACRVAACGRTSLYEAIKTGALTARKRGRRTIILSNDLWGWLESLPTAPAADPAPVAA